MSNTAVIEKWVDDVTGKITLLQKTTLKERAERSFRTQFGKSPSQSEIKIEIFNILHNLAGRQNVGTRPSEIVSAIAGDIIKL